jgi:ATP-binding protein involved in chromosome partitioning
MAKPPQDIKTRRAEGTIEIRWADDDLRVYSAREVRWACPCAACVDERTGQRTLDPDTIAPDVSVTQMELVGHYAVKFVWSDGHQTGIYTWDQLRSLPHKVKR